MTNRVRWNATLCGPSFGCSEVHIVAKADRVTIKCQNSLRNVLGVLTSLFIPIALIQHFLNHNLGNQKRKL